MGAYSRLGAYILFLLHFPGSKRMLRTQLPSIFPRTEPSKTRREIVKNHLLNRRKRRKDEDTVSSLVESPTQLSNAVNDIQRLPSETVRSVSSLVESSTSNTEDEIQGSLIELGKKLKESKLKRRKFKDKLNRKKMKDYRYMFWGTRAIDLINN